MPGLYQYGWSVILSVSIDKSMLYMYTNHGGHG